MSARRVIVVFGFVIGSLVTVLAQLPTPTPALDRRGKPLPFGVPPYYLPEVPLGTGPYKAIMSQEKGLPEQVA